MTSPGAGARGSPKKIAWLQVQDTIKKRSLPCLTFPTRICTDCHLHQWLLKALDKYTEGQRSPNSHDILLEPPVSRAVCTSDYQVVGTISNKPITIAFEPSLTATGKHLSGCYWKHNSGPLVLLSQGLSWVHQCLCSDELEGWLWTAGSRTRSR